MKNMIAQLFGHQVKTGVLLLALLLMTVFTITSMLKSGLNRIEATSDKVDVLVHEHQKKLALTSDMLAAARQRSLIFLLMLAEDDPFALEDYVVALNDQANVFVPALAEFGSLQLTPKQEYLHQNLYKITSEAVPISNKAIELLRNGNLEAAGQILLDYGVPGQDDLLEAISKLQDSVLLDSQQIVGSIDHSLQGGSVNLIALSVIAIFAGVLAIGIFMVRIAKGEQLLRNRSKAILGSIREAVITTNELGEIDYLNPQAEGLLRCSSINALGRPIDDVYRVKEEKGVNFLKLSWSNADTEDRGKKLVLVDCQEHAVAIEESITKIDLASKVSTGLSVVFRDVGEHRSLNEKLRYQAFHDPLTGLLNRRAFEDHVALLLADAKKLSKRHRLLYLDLDQFKVVNDTCGHAAGDELLVQLSAIFSAEWKDKGALARLGGDEFGIAVTNCTADTVRAHAEKLLKAVQDFVFIHHGQTYRLGVSIGVAELSRETYDVDQVFSEADIACYNAKNAGRNTVSYYDANDRGMREERVSMEWAGRLGKALADNEFELYAQKVLPVKDYSSAYTHVEILLRLKEESGNRVLPGAFIPPAERFGLMPEVDRWVIQQTFKYMSEAPLLACNINLSGDVIGDGNLLEFIKHQMEVHAINAERLTFEITETSAIRNIQLASLLFSSLRSIGCNVALDDFGTGLSSFSYLKDLPVDGIKIDRSFVDELTTDPISREIVNSIVGIAKSLDMKVVAEGVTKTSTLALLHEMKIDLAQGYVLHTPEPITQIIAENIKQ